MNRARLFSLLTVASLVAAPSLRAQTEVTVVLTAPYAPPNQAAVTAFGYYMSPYSGTVDGVTERLYCVDFFHDVNIGQVWTATKVNLGDAILNPELMKFTREGSNGYYSDMTDVLHVYQEAAWLSQQVPANPGATALSKTLTTAIQTAIWSIVSNLPGHVYQTAVPAYVVGSFDLNNADPYSTGYWINQALQNYGSQSNAYYGAFNIITDIHKLNDGSVYSADRSAQEFMYHTPEPGTWVLMATGFAMVGGVARKRRKAQRESESSTEELQS